MMVAIVTGAGGGLGRAIVGRLLADGLAVAAWDSRRESLDGLGSQVLPCEVDVGDAASVQRALDATLVWRDRVDVLVNNAGIPGPNAGVADYPLQEWEAVLRVNLTGVFLCTRAALAPLQSAPAGRVVNIASVAGKLASPGISAYAASKAGVIAFTKAVAREVAHTPLRINCITPGAIRTDIFKRWPEAYVQGLVEKIPLGRFGTPEELAALTSWLSSGASSFCTGAVFDLSGGRADH